VLPSSSPVLLVTPLLPPSELELLLSPSSSASLSSSSAAEAAAPLLPLSELELLLSSPSSASLSSSSAADASSCQQLARSPQMRAIARPRAR
jgi:hypothetical protein